MSYEGQFARNISFASGETHHDQSVPGIQSMGGQSTVRNPAHTASHGSDGQTDSESARANASSLAIVNALEGILDDFRNKKVAKPRTIALLTSKLDFDVSRNEPEKDAALAQYLNSIESIERLAVEATQRGMHAARGLGGGNVEPPVGNPVIESESADRAGFAPNKETGDFVRSLALEQSRKRHRADLSDDEEAVDREDDEPSEGLSNKKKRVFEKDMPWFQRESAARQSANPSCTKTREILTTFASDYTSIKHWITISISAPCGFPTAEWENIIKGKAVNLDSVLSSLHHISPVKENVGRVGTTEISLGRSEPTRKVRTSGEWTSAWNATIKATAFAFPNREDELREYGDYMDREFSSKVVSAHRKLILYDEAVRGEVAGGQKILLTDRSHFSYIYSAIVLPDGIESEVGRNFTSSNASKPRADICRRFNSTAQCPFDTANCRFRHVCSDCKRPGHSKQDCPTGEGKTSKKSSS